jgi:hypothetical protein
MAELANRLVSLDPLATRTREELCFQQVAIEPVQAAACYAE